MDWKALLGALSAAGQTQAQIAADCGVAQSTISDLSCGRTKSPSFELGRRLIALRKKSKRAEKKAA